MALDFKNYQQVSQNNREMIRNDLWEMRIINLNPAIYRPSDDIINIRVQNVDLGISMEIESIDVQYRGFNLTQPTNVMTSGALSFTLTDMEDMSMQWMFEDWANMICTRDDRQHHKKSEVIAEVEFIQYNTSRKPIKSFYFWGCHPIVNPQHEQNGFDASNAQNIGMLNWTLKYEHYQRNILTAPDQDYSKK